MKARGEALDGATVIRISLAAAAVGLVASVAGALLEPQRLLFAYLAAWAAVAYLAVGALVLLLTVHAMRAGWPTALRRVVEGMVAALPAIGVLFLPLFPWLGWIYPWVHPEAAQDPHARHALEHRAHWMTPTFFAVRSLVYFAVWIGAAAALRRWSLAQDAGARPELRDRMYAVSGALLPVVALAIVFSSFDWLMSLEPTWYSTMYPIYVFSSGFVGALGALTALAWAAERRGYLAGLHASHYYALGRLLLAFTIFWAYAAFFQLMLIWIANKPEEVAYYLDRWQGPFRPASILLGITRFAFPFLVLMTYRIKRLPRPLAWMALLVVAATWVDFHWLVVPRLHPRGAPWHLLDLGPLALVAGLAAAFAAWRMRGLPTVPVGDQRLDEAFAYRSK
jgi:hypothetical protein